MLNHMVIEGYLLAPGIESIMFYFIASFNDLPAVNFGVFRRAMVITSPVFGLRPFLALLSRTEKVPNPTSITFCLFFKLFFIALSVTFRAFDASALVIFVL